MNTQHACTASCWRKWFLFFDLNGFLEFAHITEAVTEACSLKIRSCSWILPKFLKNSYENFKFWEAANLPPATLLTLFRSIFQGFCLLFRNTYFKEYLWVTASAYSTPMHAFYAWMPSSLVWYSAKFCKHCVFSKYFQTVISSKSSL